MLELFYTCWVNLNVLIESSQPLLLLFKMWLIENFKLHM